MVKMTLKNFRLFFLSVSLVTGFVLVGGCAAGETTTQEAPTQIIEDVTPGEAFTLIESNQHNPDFVIIAIQTSPEFASGHIENAINIDFNCDTYHDEINNLDRSKTYLIYCRSGRGSRNTLRMMVTLKFKEVYNISGGILAWEAEDLPITQ